MTSQSNGSANSYQISVSKKVAAEIKEVIKKAHLSGKKPAAISALRVIEERLRSNPMGFGECRFHWIMAKCRCHIGVIEPIAVQFAIHDHHPVVFLTKVLLMGN